MWQYNVYYKGNKLFTNNAIHVIYYNIIFYILVVCEYTRIMGEGSFTITIQVAICTFLTYSF